MKLNKWYKEIDSYTSLSYFFLRFFKKEVSASGHEIHIEDGAKYRFISNKTFSPYLDVWPNKDIVEEISEIIVAIFESSNRKQI